MAKSTCSFRKCGSPIRARGLCNKHYLIAWNDGTLELVAPWRPTTFEQRFWAKVDRGSATECWPWLAGCCRNGYGRSTAAPVSGATLAHRIAYELLVGPIPDGLVLDHLCRNPPCVNPVHMEPVTAEENTRRGALFQQPVEVCKSGHPFNEVNTYYARRTGKRACRICHNRWSQERRQRGQRS